MSNRINNVAIVGGTHGNELTGVYLVNHWMKNLKHVKRSSFKTTLLHANPRAIKEVRRYIDKDLNRSFKIEYLKNPNDNIYESKRAIEINKILGEKGSNNNKMDFILDLHTTTSNMGLSIVVSNDSELTWQAIAYLSENVPSLKVYRWEGDEEKSFLDSIAPHGFAIEVGPVAQGILRADLYLQTRDLVMHLLDFLEKYNYNQLEKKELNVEYYDHEELIDYPRDSDGKLIAMVHPDMQDKDYKLLTKDDPIFMDFDANTIVYDKDESLHALFINEAAYYEKGFAMCLARKSVKNIKFY